MKLNQQIWKLLFDALKGTLGPVARREFDQWMTDEQNRRFYANLAKTWDEIQRRAAACEPDRERMWNQLQERIAAASPAPTPLCAPTRSPRRNLFQLAAAVVITAVVALSAVYMIQPQLPNAEAEQLISAIEGKSQARLTDGSVVWLNRSSSLRYNNRFGGDRRDVELTGEAFFDIAKDSERPFTVRIEGLDIRVHGTKFNVRYSSCNQLISVSLLEGSVALHTPKNLQQMLRPGQIATYDLRSQELAVNPGDVDLETCWAKGRMSFDNQSLGEICRYLSRWYGTQIHISPSITGRYAYTFTITNEPLEEILRIMGRINPITYNFSEDNTVSITELDKKRKPSPMK